VMRPLFGTVLSDSVQTIRLPADAIALSFFH
jgi:hypothetical protein